MTTLVLARKDNWPRLLNEYLVSLQGKEFEYGIFDCCIMAAGAVEKITGVDPMSEFRGEYNSESYVAALQDLGHGNLYKTLTKKFGKAVPAAHGKRGDIAWFQGCCGIIIGRQAIFLFEDGFGYVPITRCQRAFHVGKA